MKYIFLLTLLLISSGVWGQTLKSLFPAEGHSPKVLIPFQVSGTGNIQLQQIVFDNNQAQCKSMNDFYVPNIFHIKCQNSGGMKLSVLFREDGVLKILSTSLLTIKNPQAGTIVIPEGEDPMVTQGRVLHANNCSGCHGEKAARSALQITNAIKDVNEMKTMCPNTSRPKCSPVLTPAQINAIAVYLGIL